MVPPNPLREALLADVRELQRRLKAQGVARIYTPGEATLTQIIRDIIDTVDAARAQAGAA